MIHFTKWFTSFMFRYLVKWKKDNFVNWYSIIQKFLVLLNDWVGFDWNQNFFKRKGCCHETLSWFKSKTHCLMELKCSSLNIFEVFRLNFFFPSLAKSNWTLRCLLVILFTRCYNMHITLIWVKESKWKYSC